MFKLTFFKPAVPFTPAQRYIPQTRCEYVRRTQHKLHALALPNEETATIIAGALMRKGYCVRLWGRRDQLIF
jgi:hypothetical protein